MDLSIRACFISSNRLSFIYLIHLLVIITPSRWSFAIIAVCLSVCLSIPNERVYISSLNMVDVGKG